MKLRVLLPSHIFLDEDVSKVTAEGEEGFFCLLPRHVDYTAALVPGLLSYESPDGEENILAVDEGILVKYGDTVLVSVRNAARGRSLGTLKPDVEEELEALEEREKLARTAAAKLEANLVRKFMDLGEHGRT
jgi:F-type H+-transporting ATPase subunit epsilon